MKHCFLQVKMTEKNKRNDLYVLANSYHGRLKNQRPNFVQETDFHIVQPKETTTKVWCNKFFILKMGVVILFPNFIIWLKVNGEKASKENGEDKELIVKVTLLDPGICEV